MIKLIKGEAVLTPNNLLQTILEEPTSSWDDPETAWQDRCYLRDNFVGADLGGLQSWMGKLKINTRTVLFLRPRPRPRQRPRPMPRQRPRPRQRPSPRRRPVALPSPKSKTKGKEKAEDKVQGKGQGKVQGKGQSENSTSIGFEEAGDKVHQEPGGQKGNRKESSGPTWS